MNREKIRQQAREKITKGVLSLRRIDKHDAYMTTSLELVEDWECSTGWTDGVHLGLNPEWVTRQTMGQLRSFFAHENDHNRGGHPWRMLRLPKYLWPFFNAAADFQINARLKRRGFEAIDGWLLRPEFDKMSTEAIAWKLWEEAGSPTDVPDPQNREDQYSSGDEEQEDDGSSETGENGDESAPSDEGDDESGEGSDDGSGAGGEEEDDKTENRPGGSGEPTTEGGGDEENSVGQSADGEGDQESEAGEGESESGSGDGGSEDGPDRSDLSDLDCRPYPAEGDSEEEREQDADRGFRELRRDLSNAVRYAEANGGMDPAMLREIGKLLDPGVPYAEILREFMDEAAADDLSWSHPQRDYYARGMYVPSFHSEKLREVVYIVDTSGSMNSKAFGVANADILSICGDLGATLRVVYVDSKVRGVQEFSPDDDAEDFQPHGGGGTDFRPGFDWIEKNEIEPVAVIMLTDLMCNAEKWPSEPDYPVFVVKWGTFPHEMFGLPEWPTIIEMDEEHWT